MPRSREILACAPAAAACALALAAAPAAADPTLAAPTVVAGPSAEIRSLGGLSVARDGSGGAAFTESVGGVDHVFVARLAAGRFEPPVQVDLGLAEPSAKPVIAAGNGGLLLVAFVNAGALYTAGAASASAPLSAPEQLVAGAADPAISITNFGKAYLAFTAAGAGGHDVRAAAYDAGRWRLEPTALDAAAADDAGTGTGRPAVAAAGDGVAIVAWGENGHIYSRRVRGTSPSTSFQQADPPMIVGEREVSADDPTVTAGGDSSFAAVGFRETVQTGSGAQVRVVMNRLAAGRYQGAVTADGSPAVSDGADDPLAASSEFGRGFVLSTRTSSHGLYALDLMAGENPGSVQRIDSLPNGADPAAAVGIAGLFSSLVAWQQSPALGPPEIRVRYGADGGELGPEQVASNPSLGPAQAGSGLAAGGDVAGDAAAAWVQGTGDATRIVAAQLYQPPGAFALDDRGGYADVAEPQFSWSQSRDSWGPVVYRLLIDGNVVAQTTAASLRSPVALADGPHAWQVLAVNPAGVSAAATPSTIRVDTLAPLVTATLTGRRVVGAGLQLRLTVTDLRPGEPASASSGIASRSVGWGDGTTTDVRSGASHAYARAGLYRLLVSVADRAGNVTRIARYLRIRPRPAHHRRAGRRRHR